MASTLLLSSHYRGVFTFLSLKPVAAQIRHTIRVPA